MKNNGKDIFREWIDINPNLSDIDVKLNTQFILFSNNIINTRCNFCKSYGLNTSEFDVIATLYRSGGKHELTAKELKERTLLPSSGALSNRVDRLESKGLTKRQHDTRDKRSVKIALTKSGLDLVQKIHPIFFDVMSEQFSNLSDDDKKSLINIMSKVT
ncbi:MarR family winged helix-turn-helix transcriptional regulator [Vibrio sp. 10N.222.55.E8]|uniref:MarR family winged helix-turn-helix transcriptional regulator n=1 Tax=Vibrio artabrorum TaxID=446374 RepID=UPI0035534303